MTSFLAIVGNQKRSQATIATSAGAADASKVPRTNASGFLDVAVGGTGANTAANARANLGLGTIATQSASNIAITGGSADGLTSASATKFGSSTPWNDIGCRLSLSTSSQSPYDESLTGSTLYYGAFNSRSLQLWNTTLSRWEKVILSSGTSLSIAIPATAGAVNYDVFCYLVAGNPTLYLEVWGATRTYLANQNGLIVHSTDRSKLWLGSIRAENGICSDIPAKRFLWNFWNRVHKPVADYDATTIWTYAGTWRPWNNSTANRIEVLAGLTSLIDVSFHARFDTSGASIYGALSIGLDSTTTPSTMWNYCGNTTASFMQSPRLAKAITEGYHYFQALESTFNSTTVSFIGQNCGLEGTWIC